MQVILLQMEPNKTESVPTRNLIDAYEADEASPCHDRCAAFALEVAMWAAGDDEPGDVGDVGDVGSPCHSRRAALFLQTWTC